MNAPKIILPTLLAAVLMLMACSSYERNAVERERRAQRGTGDIRIALVWQEKLFKSFFYEGAELAADEINRSGGIQGRMIRTARYNNESGSLAKDLSLARKIAADRDIVAIVGHYSGLASIEASVTYEYNGLVFIAVTATLPAFTKHGFRYVFRNIPSDRTTGRQLADFAKKRGFSRIVMIDDRTVYGKSLADVFHQRASQIGLSVVVRRSYDELGKDFKPLFAEIRKYSFDAVFLGGSIPTAGEVIRQARLMGVTVPFIGGDGLDSPTLWDIAGPAAEGTMTPTTYHHSEKSAAAQAFGKAFSARYGSHPDTWSGHGYDAIRMLAMAIRKGGSTIPAVVASHLRYLEPRQGVLGSYAFTQTGDVEGDINEFQVLHNGKYELLEGDLP